MHQEWIIKLPELGEGVTEGELVKWLVSEGDSIKTDQPLAEVMTDKAVMEIPAPQDGIVESFLAKKGDTIPVGHKLLKLQSGEKPHQPENLRAKNQDNPAEVTKPPSTQLEKSQPLPAESPSDQADEADPALLDTSRRDIQASPFVRRWAKELKIDLSQVRASRPDGRISQEDVLKYSKSHQGGAGGLLSEGPLGFKVPKEVGQDRQALTGIRKKIAQKMQASKAVIPHFTLLESAEVEQLDKLKSTVKENLQEKNIKVTYLSFVMKALLQTLTEFPALNASIDDISQEIVYKNYYHFGFAVDTPRGLLVPVIKNVEKKSLATLSYEIQTLAKKARQGGLKVEDMQGGTITITNIGSLGGEYATPIINPPESAILGMYRLFIKACWDGAQFVPKKTMNFSLTCDHRLIDGAVSAKALKYFIHKIENPLSLFI